MSAILKEIIGLQDPDVCYQCRRCTSGCPIAYLVKDFRPHRIVAMVNLGFIEEVLRADFIWDCTRCYKCTEYCPQRVAPSDIVLSLQALCVERGIRFPDEYRNMILRISRTGFSFEEMEVADREMEIYDRKSLGLPPLTPPSKIDIVGKIVLSLGGIKE